MMKIIHGTIWVLLLTSIAMAKRDAPKDVLPIVTENAVYTAPHVKLPQFSTRNPGFVEARHPETKKLLWRIQIYNIKYDPALEQDVQDVFIKTMSLDKKNNSLLISDERSRTYVLDLTTKAVTREVSDAQTEMRRGLCYIKGETKPFTGREISYTSGLKPISTRGMKVVTTYLEGKEQDVVFHAPWGKVRPRK